MAYAPFRVTITNVAGSLFDGEATLLTVPSTMGVTTILAHHEPLIALLKEGSIILHDSEGVETTYPVTGGVVEVSNNRAIVLV